MRKKLRAALAFVTALGAVWSVLRSDEHPDHTNVK